MGREGFSPSPEQMFNREGKKPGEIDSFFRDLADKYPKVRKTALMFAVMGATLGFAESAQAQENSIEQHPPAESQEDYEAHVNEVLDEAVSSSIIDRAVKNFKELNEFDSGLEKIYEGNILFQTKNSFFSVVEDGKAKEFNFSERLSDKWHPPMTKNYWGSLQDSWHDIVIFSRIKSIHEAALVDNSEESWGGLVNIFTVAEVPKGVEIEEIGEATFESFGSTRENALIAALDVAAVYSKINVKQEVYSNEKDEFSDSTDTNKNEASHAVQDSSIKINTDSGTYIKRYKVVRENKTMTPTGEVYIIKLEVVFGAVK